MLKNISLEIEKSNISLQQLCKLLSISENILHSWIREETFIPSSKLFLMCKIFGCSSDYLLNQKEDRNLF